MRKLAIASVVTLAVSPVFASDYLPQEVTSEVYTNNVQVTEESYQPCDRQKLEPTYTYNLEPVTVYTGKTVTVQKHYDVYQPKVVYERVDSYTTTQTCEYCK